MEIITETELRRQIKENPARGYLFFGEEDYLKVHSLKSLKERICPDPALEPFNYIKLDGLYLTPDSLLGAISTLPMMSESKLIEITGLNFHEFKPSFVDELCKILELLPEYDYNTVVISVAANGIDEGTPKRPSEALKKFGDHLTLVRFASATPLMLGRWCEKHFLANGVRADHAVTSKLVDYCGTDMYRLATETDKISWYVLASGRDQVSPSDVESVAIADTSYDTFALTNAIADGDRGAALRVLGEMKRRRIEPYVIMGEVSSFVIAMLNVRLLADSGRSVKEIVSATGYHEFRVKMYSKANVTAQRLREMLELCGETDIDIKYGHGYGAIERLICAF